MNKTQQAIVDAHLSATCPTSNGRSCHCADDYAAAAEEANRQENIEYWTKKGLEAPDNTTTCPTCEGTKDADQIVCTDCHTEHCTACGYDLGTHHPTCPTLCPYCAADPEHATTHAPGEHGTIHPNAVTSITREHRESLASLMAGPDYYFWALMQAAQTECEGWHQYTDEAGDTWTTNSEY